MKVVQWLILSLLVLLGALIIVQAQETSRKSGSSASYNLETEKALKEFKEARFGLFIHWGVYAVPAGKMSRK